MTDRWLSTAQTLHGFLISKEEAQGRAEKKWRKESRRTIYKQEQHTEGKRSSDVINDHIDIG